MIDLYLSLEERNQYYLEESKYIETVDGLELWRVGNKEFHKFNEFVYKVYKEAFSENGNTPFNFSDIETQSAIYFNRTKVCCIKHPDGTFLGTWGLVLKDIHKDKFSLPIEVNYKLSVEQILNSVNDTIEVRYLFNGWRTAIDKEAMDRLNLPKQKSIFIFDYLLRGLTRDFSEDSKTYLGVSEMELLVFKYHRRIGIPWVILGDPINYWGRDRYPCAFKLGEFEDYLIKNHPDRHKFIYGKL